MEYDISNLKRNNFSDAGCERFVRTINEFEKELFNKSIDFGKINKEKDMPLEITSDNVRDAVINIKNSPIKHKINPIFIILNILEYVFAIAATIGANNLSENWGILLFGICAGLTVILITIRLVNRR